MTLSHNEEVLFGGINGPEEYEARLNDDSELLALFENATAYKIPKQKNRRQA